jgi:hypothetical protein
MCLAAVFDDGEVVARGGSGQRRHVSRLTVEMDGHNRPCACADRRRACGRIHRQRLVLDVDDHRRGSGGDDSQRGIRRRNRRDDDLIARTDAGGAQEQGDRIRAVSRADRESSAAGSGEFGLECVDFRAEDVPATCCYACDRVANGAGVLAQAEVKKGNLGGFGHDGDADAAAGTY